MGAGYLHHAWLHLVSRPPMHKIPACLFFTVELFRPSLPLFLWDWDLPSSSPLPRSLRSLSFGLDRCMALLIEADVGRSVPLKPTMRILMHLMEPDESVASGLVQVKVQISHLSCLVYIYLDEMHFLKPPVSLTPTC